jgi:transforming growth factor-beta-induced protein
MQRRFRHVTVVAAVAAITLAACGDDGNDEAESATAPAAAPATTSPASATMDPGSGMDAPGTIVDVAVDAGDFNTLVAAVQAAGLVETLSGPGPFTVLAPTDEAFAASLESLGLTAEELLADTETLTSILTYHVIAGEVPSSSVVTMNGEAVPTVNGADVLISVDGETVMVNEATVTAVDIAASNGVIHVIDSVLVPPAA